MHISATERWGRSSRVPATWTPASNARGEAELRLNIRVVFTTIQGTMAALRTAGALARQLGGRITLMVPEIVPFHLPLNKPPILRDWNERRFRVLAAGCPVETSVRFYLCRDRDETLANALKPQSLVVIGGKKKRWWSTPESRLAARLRSLGHEVILQETE